MMQNKTKNHRKALEYIRQGYAVLPVKDKIARVAWKQFQEMQPATELINAWHDAGMFSDGIAIITGDVSGRLLVIDFDDYGMADDFMKTFPELAKTYRVATKRGIHFYFILASDVLAHSHKLPGVDIQFNGRYVVAPPTENYQLISDSAPLTLSAVDYNLILRRFNSAETIIEPAQALTAVNIMSIKALISIYRKDAPTGRNEALFQVVKMARDYGYYPNDLITGGLQDAFVFSDSSNGKQEKQKARMREYTRTVASVYSRPARQLRDDMELLSISDDARERLHRNSEPGIARALDAIMSEFSGQKVTRKDVYKAFQGVIDWKVLDKALKATFEGKILFSRAPLPPRPHHQQAIAGKDTTIYAYSGVKKTEKSMNTRIAERFIVPSAEAIQRITGAEKRASTLIAREHLVSPRKYKMRLMVGKIERTQHYAFHANKWLARIFNVTKRTIQTYTKLAGLHVQERYQTLQKIYHMEQAQSLRDAEPGMFLIDERGKKYPAKVDVAERLLMLGKTLFLRRQMSNYYSTKAIATPENKSRTFGNDMSDLMARFEAGISLATIARQNKPNPDLEAFKAQYWQSFQAKPEETLQGAAPTATALPMPPENDENMDKWDWLQAWSKHMNAIDDLVAIDTYDGFTGISEPSEKSLQRRRVQSACEDAKSLTMLMPHIDGKRTLRHETASDLILEYGADTCLQEAMKINMEYQFGRGKQAIKNPVAVLIHRLKLSAKICR